MKALGKFEILDRLGQGAMGVVYKARDPRIGRPVALKTITTGLAEDPALLERFYHEAHSAGALQHPNIVTIYEMGEAENTPFIAMEYLSGESLDKLIEARRTLPLSQKVGYVAYVCRALAYAHKQGVVHRDVKPGNVMVTTEGTVKVVDFGIARIAENSKSQTGLVIGTLAYMSPQQIEGGRAEARSDIWAAGVLFYELLAYRRPFDGDNYGALMLNVMTQPIPPLSQAAPGTPPEVEAVLDRMLRKNVEERFQSMEEVLIELEPVWRGLQRSEVVDLLAASREMLKAGDTAKAFETVRRVLQIDSANAEAKTLLDHVNAEIKKNRTSAPAEKTPATDETLVGGPSLSSVRPTASSIPALTASRAQSTASHPVPPTTGTQQAGAQSGVKSGVAVQPEPVAPSMPVPAQSAGKNWTGIAVGVLAVVIIGGGASFFLLRAKGPTVPDAKVAQGANISNAAPVAATDVSSNVPSSASSAPQNKQSVPVTGLTGTAPSRANNDTSAQARPNNVPQQQPPKGQTPATQAANPAPAARTEMALNTAAPPPAAERPSQPVAAANPQPVAPTPAPAPAAPTPAPTPVAAAPAPTPTPAAAPAPAPKAAEPAAPAKAAEPAPVVASGASGESNVDRQAINVSLQQLSAAFSHRNISEIEELWPKGNKNTLNALKTVFGSVKSMTREFHAQSVTISPDGNSATAIGTYQGKFTDARGVDTPNSGNFYVRLAKRNGRWFIDDASF